MTRRVTVNTAFMSTPHPVWTATLDGHPDMIGHGTQEADAIYDLFCQIAEREAQDEDDQERHEQTTTTSKPRGTCDVCERQHVPISRCWATGIETFACDECRGIEPDEDES